MILTWIAIVAHVAVNGATGWALLSRNVGNRTSAETACLAVPLGMYVDTLVVGLLVVLGLSVHAAVGVMLCATALLVTVTVVHERPSAPSWPAVRLRWYEWVVAFAVAEKLLVVVWLLTRTHVYFDDALTIWSARPRALYGGTNWSLDPTSPVFLAGHIRENIVHYPWQTGLWRATTAVIRGEWNDTLARADGVVLFVVLIAAVWLLVWRLSHRRGLAAAATFVVASIPLQVWQAASGYSDLAVETFALLGVAALLRHEWFWAGVMAAGTVWSKNDGLVIWVPALLAALVMLQESRSAVLRFMGGLASLTPWLVFKARYGLGVTPNQEGFAWHPAAFGLLWEAAFRSPTSGILWIAAVICLLATGSVLAHDRMGRALLAASLAAGALTIAVFSLTDAFVFLENQGTVHRSLLQLTAVTVVSCAYGVDRMLRRRCRASRD